MTPPLAGDDPGNLRLTNAECNGESPLALAIGMSGDNFPDLLLGDFRHAVAFPLSQGSVMTFVVLVLCGRPPAQVVEPVVRWVAISVSGLQTVRAATDERFQDKLVDQVALPLPVTGERDSVVPLGVDAGLQDATGWSASDVPEIGYLVEVFEVRHDDRSPVLFNHARYST